MNKHHEPICFDMGWWFDSGMKVPTPAIFFLEDRQDAHSLTVAASGVAIHRAVQKVQEMAKGGSALVFVNGEPYWTIFCLTAVGMLQRLLEC